MGNAVDFTLGEAPEQPVSVFKIYSGGAWVIGRLKYFDGTSWQEKVVKRFDGSIWMPT
jgi:hypothetical protein